ncbi:DUF3068 domain-containing protein [Corynebacterium comes]|uniref:DUF3068 domain-containing protein n=1 Tax=Corynebacterium comes TaxID=2675218 RepID=A0A6B8VRK2_9CORY|nr:DUF3068 domain-containing protein [Corynebacterium comes]QGU05689.1 hypothetical protein CETAM_12290 [Corynebacterium comes]
MSESVFRRPPIRLLLIAAVVFLLGSLLPPLVITQLKPLPLDLQESFTTRPADTVMLAPSAVDSGAVPDQNRERPECRDGSFPDVPYSCLVMETTTHRDLRVHTGESEEPGDINVEATTRLLAGESVVLELRDSLRLDRSSTYPVADPVSRVETSVPGLADGTSTGPFVREGLQYFFPFPPEPRSYPRYDMIAEQPLLLDYVGEVDRNGLETFEFHHTFTAFPLSDPDDNRPRPEAPEAGVLDSLRAWGTGSPWYAIDRTVWVEPKSGTIVDTAERIHVYFAVDRAQAEERAFDPSPEFTLLHTSSTWDDETLARQHDKAAEVVSTLRVLQIFAVVLKAIALVAVIWAVVLLLRERRGQAS